MEAVGLLSWKAILTEKDERLIESAGMVILEAWSLT